MVGLRVGLAVVGWAVVGWAVGLAVVGWAVGLAVVGLAVVGAAVVGLAVVGLAVVGLAVVGAAVGLAVGLAVVGFAVVGLAVGLAVTGAAVVGLPVVGLPVVGFAVVGAIGCDSTHTATTATSTKANNALTFIVGTQTLPPHPWRCCPPERESGSAEQLRVCCPSDHTSRLFVWEEPIQRQNATTGCMLRKTGQNACRRSRRGAGQPGCPL